MTTASPEAFRRDPFGIEPLYYRIDDERVWSGLPQVPFAPGDRADESVLVEYLGLGEVWDPEAAFIQNMRRVPPGFERRDGEVSRWFTRPVVDLTQLTERPLVQEFWERFGDAVERASAGRNVVVSMSGGLDSCAIAAVAVERLGAGRVRSLTVGHERDFEDPEPPLARQVAAHLGIEWGFISSDETDLVAEWGDVPFWPQEPATAAGLEWDAAIPDDAVVLSGLGGDSLLRGDRKHYARRLRRGELGGAARDALRTVVLHGKRPAFGLSRLFGEPPEYPRPGWLRRHPAFDRAVERRRDVIAACDRGLDELFAPLWPYIFESSAPENVPDGPTYAYPFFDLEFATFVASVPTAPWCVDKEILRAALRGKVPEAIRTRPKAPVEGSPLVTMTTTGVDSIQAALETGAADHLVDPRNIELIRPGVHVRADLTPLVRVAAVYRWLDFLAGGAGAA